MFLFMLVKCCRLCGGCTGQLVQGPTREVRVLVSAQPLSSAVRRLVLDTLTWLA